MIETNENPPTYNKSNRFTQGFQNLIDSYGIASYHEVNPGTYTFFQFFAYDIIFVIISTALYTIITFPFLFAVMFGDIGHGIIVLLFGAYLCIWEQKIIDKRIKDEVFNIFFGGRYIILLMGFFAVYTGFIYNDIFSKSFNIFGSSWNMTDPTIMKQEDEWILDPRWDERGDPYYLGVDPVWQVCTFSVFDLLLAIFR